MHYLILTVNADERVDTVGIEPDRSEAVRRARQLLGEGRAERVQVHAEDEAGASHLVYAGTKHATWEENN